MKSLKNGQNDQNPDMETDDRNTEYLQQLLQAKVVVSNSSIDHWYQGLPFDYLTFMSQ